jgi:hypothetical protein
MNQYNFDVDVNTIFTEEEIRVSTTLMQNAYETVYTKMIQLEDEAVRNALIALGWTPPDNRKDK